MILLRRLTAILLTLVAALFGSTAAGGAVLHVAPHFGTYAYDNHHHSAGLVDIPTEPGPVSSSHSDGTAYDAVDGWAHVASADRDAIPPSTATTYNDFATLVHVESAGPTTRGPTQVTGGRSVVCDRTSVAAETAVAGERAVAMGPAPENAWKVLDSVASRRSSLPGYKGGGPFANDGRAGSQVLPRTTSGGDAVKYHEWDVNPLVKGVNRGLERLVTGSDGSAFYTNDHYLNFVQIR